MPEKNQIPISSNNLQVMYQWVFTNTMQDLFTRIYPPELSGDRYQLLGLAPLLRKLLLDSMPLVDRANQSHKLKIVYQICPFDLTHLDCQNLIHLMHPGLTMPITEIPGWRVMLPGQLIPDDENPGESLGLPHFLATDIGAVNGHRPTVREIIKFYSNVEGGVHIGDPKADFERNLFATAPYELTQTDQGIDASPLGALHSISIITLNALRPLGEAINNAPLFPDPVDGLLLAPIGQSPLGEKWWEGMKSER